MPPSFGGESFVFFGIFESEIRKQVELAIDEANVILFLVDAKAGITDLDQAVVKLLRRSNKKVF